MDTGELVEALSRPEAYPHAARDLEVHQTHISVVFLADDFAYKVKKPRDLGFLDFTTPEKRLHYCHEEVRLNRRLAPGVYLGVVPILRDDDGVRVGEETLAPPDDGGGPAPGRSGPADGRRGPDPGAASGDGAVVAHAVKMRRLPPGATLLAALERNGLEAADLERVADRLARFHAEAAGGPRVARFGRWDVVARNARENLEQAAPDVGETLSAPVADRLSRRLEERLDALRGSIERRAAAGVPRDTHGDLHLEHVYRFPDREPPQDLVAIDCIEFNERFRHADPVSDVAFLSMDLRFHGREDLARALEAAWLEGSGDADGSALFPFYVSYRAAVRGKVEGIAATEEEIEPGEREGARRRARAYWLLALSRLDPPRHRPGLVLIGGLPGTGKSTLAAALAEAAGFRVLSSDVVRKELAGLDPDASAAAGFGQGIYTERWNDRTYDALAERAAGLLFRGERVIVDASFREEARRRQLLDVARGLALRSLLLTCDAPPSEARARLEARRGTAAASDAGVAVYQRAAEDWEDPDPRPAERRDRVDTGAVAEDASVREALGRLGEAGLW